MLTDAEKEKLISVANSLDVLTADEIAQYAKLLLDAAEKIKLLEIELAEKQKLIDGEVKKSMDDLSAFILAGLNLR